MIDADLQCHQLVNHTSTSLIRRIRVNDQEAWRRLVRLYGPLVDRWCRRAGLQDADVADVWQEIFRTVAQSIDRFRHDRPSDTFRGWLRLITRSRIVDFVRQNASSIVASGGSTAQLRILDVPALAGADSGSGDEEDEKRLLVRRALELAMENCKEETRQAFLRVVVGGQHPVDVAKDLGISVNAVYLAKSHILRRIRAEYAQIVDD